MGVAFGQGHANKSDAKLNATSTKRILLPLIPELPEKRLTDKADASRIHFLTRASK